MNNRATPCDKNCPRRSATCHADCPEYKEYWDDNEKRRAEYYKWLGAAEYGYDRGRKIKQKHFRTRRK